MSAQWTLRPTPAADSSCRGSNGPAGTTHRSPLTNSAISTDGRVRFVGGRLRAGVSVSGPTTSFVIAQDFAIAVVEAEAEYRSAQDGVQQARDYAEILDLRFAYASNGRDIIEIDLAAGTEREVAEFPTPDELWSRLRPELSLGSPSAEETVLTPGFPDAERPLRLRRSPSTARWKRLPAVAAALLLNLWHGHRQDGRGLPNLLETLVVAVEPHRRTPAATDSVPGRPQHPDRRSDGEDVRPVR